MESKIDPKEENKPHICKRRKKDMKMCFYIERQNCRGVYAHGDEIPKGGENHGARAYSNTTMGPGMDRGISSSTLYHLHYYQTFISTK
jgi:hypothetical protein